MRGIALALLLGLAACAHETAITVQVKVCWQQVDGVWMEESRWVSVPEGASVMDATRRLVRWPRRHGARESRRDFFAKALLRRSENEPREDGTWAWSIGGVFPEVDAAQWAVRHGDQIVWSWNR
jgi:hypothetical protein